MRIIYILLIVFMAVELFSCSPKYRFNHFLKNHPGFIKKDTVWKDDTIVTKAHTIDTIFSNKYHHDTVFSVTHDKVTERIYLKGDTIRTTVYVAPDTTHKREAETITNIQPDNDKKSEISDLVELIKLFLVLFILIEIIKLFKNK